MRWTELDDFDVEEKRRIRNLCDVSLKNILDFFHQNLFKLAEVKRMIEKTTDQSIIHSIVEDQKKSSTLEALDVLFDVQ